MSESTGPKNGRAECQLRFSALSWKSLPWVPHHHLLYHSHACFPHPPSGSPPMSPTHSPDLSQLCCHLLGPTCWRPHLFSPPTSGCSPGPGTFPRSVNGLRDFRSQDSQRAAGQAEPTGIWGGLAQPPYRWTRAPRRQGDTCFCTHRCPLPALQCSPVRALLYVARAGLGLRGESRHVFTQVPAN